MKWISSACGKAAACLILLCLTGTDAPAENAPAGPTVSLYANRGLSETVSARTMGAGRLSFNLTGAWYGQEISIPSAPNQGADIITGTGACSFAVNNYFDVFGAVSGFGSLNFDNPVTSGLGTVAGGVQGALPLPADLPFFAGAQLAVLAGTSSDQINRNNADGYNYFETRAGYDFSGKLLQSLIFGSETRSIQIHLNEGLVSSLEKDKNNLLLLALGLQGNLNKYFAAGLEVNSRAFISHYSPRTDPLWITPSVQVRTPYSFNFLFGVDVSVSTDRVSPDAIRALEPYRLFSSLAFSFDLLASKREKKLAEEREDAAKKAELEEQMRESQRTAESLTLQKEQEHSRADSLARKLAQSVALLEARRKLDEEKSKRTDVEKQFLQSGAMLLDALTFDADRTTISSGSRIYLGVIAAMLKKYPRLKIEVAGNTDNAGKASTNLLLSQAQAEAVSAFMVQTVPELGGMLTAKGYGQTLPKANNRTSEGRKANRRVELHVLNKDALNEYYP